MEEEASLVIYLVDVASMALKFDTVLDDIQQPQGGCGEGHNHYMAEPSMNQGPAGHIYASTSLWWSSNPLERVPFKSWKTKLFEALSYLSFCLVFVSFCLYTLVLMSKRSLSNQSGIIINDHYVHLKNV